MADGVLTYLSSTEPVYSAPPGDALYFGGSYGGNLVFATKSLPAYVPTVGNALIFGVPGLPDTSDGVTLAALVELAGEATAKLVYAASAGGDLGLVATATVSGVFLGAVDGNLALSGAARASLAASLHLQGDLTVSGTGHGVMAVPAFAAGQLPLAGQAYFAPSWYTRRPLAGGVGVGWGLQERFDRSLVASHAQAAMNNCARTSSWGDLERISLILSGSWQQMPKIESLCGSAWGDLAGQPFGAVGVDYSSPEPRQRDALHIPWGDLLRVGRSFAADYAHPGRREIHRSIPWGLTASRDQNCEFDYSHPAVKDVFKPIISGPYWYPRWCIRRYDAPNGAGLVFDFSSGLYQVNGGALVFDYDSTEDPLICYDGTWNGPKDAYWYQPHDWEISTPDIRSYYIIMNTVSLKRVADDVAIPIMGMEIGTDLDSWCWTLSATLRREVDLDLVRPTGGAPVEVEASINGNVWRFVIESYGHDRAYGSRSYSIAGRSLSAYLADPYSLPSSLLQTSQLTAAQLADAALADTGFTASFQLTDWLVPANVYSVTNQTPMQQLLTIAAAAGGTVQSAMSATTISLLPWYATMPWEWGAATVEATLPSYQSKRTSFEARTQYSGVYVSGQNQGVMCLVKRSGTDGSDQPQMITDSLITATEAGLARGKRILADSGSRSVVSISAPLFDDPGLLKPGMLIDVVDGSTTWRGMVTRCGISAQRPTVTQNIDVLRYHGS